MRRTLHLVRDTVPPGLVAERDWVVYLTRMWLDDRGEPPSPPGSLSHAQLVQLLFAADRVITW